MVPLAIHNKQMLSLPNVPDRHPAKKITGNLISKCSFFVAENLFSNILPDILSAVLKIQNQMHFLL
jgi:hypothetical protein